MALYVQEGVVRLYKEGVAHYVQVGVAHYVQRACGTLHTKRVWHSTAETAWYKWWAQHLGVSVTGTIRVHLCPACFVRHPYASVLLSLSNHETLHDCAIIRRKIGAGAIHTPTYIDAHTHTHTHAHLHRHLLK